MATNELSLFNSSVSTVEGNSSINNDAEHVKNTEHFILARLNELRQWQESQRKSLEESQMDQKKMLLMEKHKLYALIGLSANESNLQDTVACSSESSYFLPHIPIAEVSDDKTTPKRSNDLPIDEKPLEIHSPSMNQLQKIIENMPMRSPRRDKPPDETNADIPKRPFLKRGEGLKQRFKISPDAFRLDNLPKYKYAQRMQKHAQTTKSRKQRHHRENTTNDTIASTAGITVGVTSEGQQNNAQVKCTQSSNQCENSTKPTQNTKRAHPKRPSPQQLKLKPNIVQHSQPSKFKLPSNDLHQFSRNPGKWMLHLGQEEKNHNLKLALSRPS